MRNKLFSMVDIDFKINDPSFFRHKSDLFPFFSSSSWDGELKNYSARRAVRHTETSLRRFLNHFLYGLATSFSRFKRCESLTPLPKEPAAARSPWKLLLEKSLSHEPRSRTRFPTNETAVNVCQLSSTSHDTLRGKRVQENICTRCY